MSGEPLPKRIKKCDLCETEIHEISTYSPVEPLQKYMRIFIDAELERNQKEHKDNPHAWIYFLSYSIKKMSDELECSIRNLNKPNV